MKIILLGTAYPYRGGLAEFNERLTKQFNNEGHQARIETFTLQYPDFLFPGKTQYSTEAAPADLDITRGMNAVKPAQLDSRGARKLKKEGVPPDPDSGCPYWVPQMAPPASAPFAPHSTQQTITPRWWAILHNVLPPRAQGQPTRCCRATSSSRLMAGVHPSPKSVMDDLDEF
jgi:D-inositol-3-phosphate glycosyltransferase